MRKILSRIYKNYNYILKDEESDTFLCGPEGFYWVVFKEDGTKIELDNRWKDLSEVTQDMYTYTDFEYDYYTYKKPMSGGNVYPVDQYVARGIAWIWRETDRPRYPYELSKHREAIPTSLGITLYRSLRYDENWVDLGFTDGKSFYAYKKACSKGIKIDANEDEKGRMTSRIVDVIEEDGKKYLGFRHSVVLKEHVIICEVKVDSGKVVGVRETEKAGKPIEHSKTLINGDARKYQFTEIIKGG
jgi:hypothetical protein